MRLLLIILAIFFSSVSFANMASPYQAGTLVSNAFTSKNVDILHESIFVKIDGDFEKANFRIEYEINTETAGHQIPLLFYAIGLYDGFKVTVDGVEIKILELNNRVYSDADSGLFQFLQDFNLPGNKQDSLIKIAWEKGNNHYYNLKELRYFETDFTKGKHKIKIEYVARTFSDRSEWIRKTSFRYSLSPAKYWRSFGDLSISLDASAVNDSVQTSLGKPSSGNLNKIAVWNFSSLPADEFVITFQPNISSTAKFLLDLGPEYMTVIFALVLFLIHLFFTLRFRKKHPEKKRNPFIAAGSVLAVLLIFIFYLYSFSIIDNLLGKEASNRHGYVFLSVIFYPIIFVIYLIILWLIELIFKRANKVNMLL